MKAKAARGAGVGHGVVCRRRRTQAAFRDVAGLAMVSYICSWTDVLHTPRQARGGSSRRDSSHVVCSPVTSIS